MFKPVLLSPSPRGKVLYVAVTSLHLFMYFEPTLYFFFDHMKIFYNFTLLFDECSTGVCFKKERLIDQIS